MSDVIHEEDFGEVEKYEMGKVDMLFTPQQQQALKSRSAYLNIQKWPSATIPYIVDSGFSRISSRVSALKQAIADYKANTCIKLVPRTNERNYVRFINGDGCYSYIGVSGGEQPISYGNGCDTTRGTPVHEIMHALGFMHEQQRPDRDSYISINYQYIESGTESNFDKIPYSQTNLLNSSYDLLSVMHYAGWAFSIDDENTITTKDSRYQNRIGQRTFFSGCDIAKINRLYNCVGYKTTC